MPSLSIVKRDIRMVYFLEDCCIDHLISTGLSIPGPSSSRDVCANMVRPYYVCQSLLKRGRRTCTTPRLNAKRFERLIIDQIRERLR